MNPPWLTPVLLLLALVFASGQLLVRTHATLQQARILTAQAESRAADAHRRADLAEARVAHGFAADRHLAALLTAWQERHHEPDALAAEALRLAAGPELLITGQQRTTTAIATTTGPTPAELIEFAATGSAASLVAWLGQLEAQLEPAALRSLRLSPGVHQVSLRATLAHPSTLP